MARRNALGRGLGALIEDAEKRSGIPGASIFEVPMDTIELNPFQPRKNIGEEALNELASSIRELGIIQPITVRQVEDGKFQLITGERRFKAAMKVGLSTIPAYVRTADDTNMLEMALVENIQREDLDSIEVAISYQRLIEECSLTQENLSDRVGKKRSTISNYLRLLKLPAEIQLAIRDRKISMGHARALINIEEPEKQLEVFDKVIKNDLSVRKVEELVRKYNRDRQTEGAPPRGKANLPEEYQDLQSQLSGYFRTEVDFRRSNKGSGKIVIPFKTDEELEKILALLDQLKH